MNINDSTAPQVILFIILAVSLAVMGYAIRALCRGGLWGGRRSLDTVILFYSAVLLALGGMLAFSQKTLCWL